MRTGTRALIIAGAAYASAAACAPSAETAGESPLVVAQDGTLSTVTSPQEGPNTTTTLDDFTNDYQVTTSLPEKVSTTIPLVEREDQPDMLITEDGIGDVYIGQKKQDVEEAGYTLIPGCGEDSYTAQNPQTSIGVDFVGGLVEQIWVYEYGPETAEGIGIGTRQEEAISILGKTGLSPSTSVLEGIHGNVDYVNVDTSGATLHFEIEGMDGAMRVSSVVVTRQGADPVYSCE